MLRDRTPACVIFALKWCRATNEWLDHVYKKFIWVYVSKKERDQATRKLLGIDKNPHKFVFEDTIDWENLSPKEELHWKFVQAWVSWFQSNHAYIQNDYEISKKVGKSMQEIKLSIMSKYLKVYCPTANDTKEECERKGKWLNTFVDFLIDSFENQLK